MTGHRVGGGWQLDRGAVQLAAQLRAQGFRALLAGGCVRDLLLGRAPLDWDIATDADPEAVGRLFAHTYAVGARFGICVVRLGGRDYEVAQFRSDGMYVDGRRPEAVATSDPQTDARRRDFTINGMFLDPETGQVLDWVGGLEDLQRRVIRAIGAAPIRFGEDRLRLLRAVRFAARLGFAVDPDTAAAITAAAATAALVSAERICHELTLILTEGGAAVGLNLLRDLGLLDHLLPEVAAMAGVPQPLQYHPEGDLWHHLEGVLAGLRTARPRLAWAALLHDVGKPRTMTCTDRIRFHNHDHVGAAMATAICRRLRMSNPDTNRISELVGQHMRLRHVREMRPGNLKRLLRQPWFPELLELHRIDCLASHGQLDLYDFCQAQLATVGAHGLRPPRLLTGDDLVAAGWAPGPAMGRALQALEDEQLEGRVTTRNQAEDFVRQWAAAAPGE
jgi:poly(A) polymerase